MSDEQQPHPDKILDDAARIIDSASTEAEMMAMFRAYQPSVYTATWMLGTLLKAGFSQETAEEMVLVVWTRYYSDVYGDWHDEYDDED